MAIFGKRYHPAGTAPGTLTVVPSPDSVRFRIRLVDYDVGQLTIEDDADVPQCAALLERNTVTWVHVEGQPPEEALQSLASAFHLHPLAVEDVLNTGQRPKAEPFPKQLFVVMSLPSMVDGVVGMHQVSLFLGENYLISFCETEFAPFALLVKRLKLEAGRLRSSGADYLLYSLLDIVIDQAYPLLESFGLQLEDIEEKVLASAAEDALADIHVVRRELILLRRNLWPQREVINELLRGDSELIHGDTHVYLRDCYDHTIQVIDLIETYRDMAASLLEIYLSSVSNRLNSVMRLLTVIATIFIPLTFVVGVYGMNFDRTAGPWSMPELSSPYGYVIVWLVMLGIAGGMLVFFRRRKWF